MQTKWLTYRVSWCNVRVKLGQSLWAGGALAKRLPLLQETDRQWEKTCQPVQWHHTFTSSARAASVVWHHRPSMWHHGRAWEQQTSTQNGTGSERRGAELSVIMFDDEEDEVAVESWWMDKEKAPIYPSAINHDESNATRQSQRTWSNKKCLCCEPRCSGSSRARPGWVKAWRETCWGWPPPGSPSTRRPRPGPGPLDTEH